MTLNITNTPQTTIPYPDFVNGQSMNDNLFDENNAALLDAINILNARLNNIVNTLNSNTDGDSGADNIKSTLISGVNGTSVQEQLEDLKKLIDQTAVAQVPDGVITLPKLNAEVLKTPNIKLSELISDLYNLAGANATVDKVLERLIPLHSYIAFCTNANSNSLDAAFGKNNTDKIHNLGLQLAMYDWFNGKDKGTFPYTNLSNCDNLQDILGNLLSKKEIVNSMEMFKLLYDSPYSRNIACNAIDITSTATANDTTLTQSIDITQTDLDVGKIFISAKQTRSQGYVGGDIKLNNVTVITIPVGSVYSGVTYETIINLATCGITSVGTYTLTKFIKYGDSYPCTLNGYISKLK